MGSSESKPDPAVEAKLVDAIQDMMLSDKEDYVHINEKESDKAPYVQDVEISTTEEWEKELLKDSKNRLALAALSANKTTDVIAQRATKIADDQTFNIMIPHEGAPVTNQRSSGRCWLFAATNVFRIALMRKYNLKEFQLSQGYLFFWDKLEKANYFLEQVLDTVDYDLDGRWVQELLNSPVGDGGQWDMVANLVEKYGLVPQTLYPDSFNAMNSASMSRLLTTKLREDALILRSLASSCSPSTRSSTIGAAKSKMLRQIHLILTIMLGPPPSPKKSFTWEYTTTDSKFHSLTTDPLSFAASLSSYDSLRANAGTDVHKLFSLVNDPRNEYGQLLTVSRLGNVIEGRATTYVNVDMNVIKYACVAQLRAGLPVFFGSDVGQYSDGVNGIMDVELFDYELAFNVKLGMTKAQRLLTGESKMTHAMVLTGVHIVDGKIVRWRVENSWGESAGQKGYFVMSDGWMDQFVYQAVVDPRFVRKEVRDILDKDPEVLPLWDPMGALA